MRYPTRNSRNGEQDWEQISRVLGFFSQINIARLIPHNEVTKVRAKYNDYHLEQLNHSKLNLELSVGVSLQ